MTETELYSYLHSFSKNDDFSVNERRVELEKYLDHPSPDIKSIAFFGLLFALKIDNERYRKLAINYLADKNEDEDLRVKCSSGLAQTYQRSKDMELLSLHYRVFKDTSDDMYVRTIVFESMLMIYGLKSREIFLRQGRSKDHFDEDDLREFSKELKAIKEIVNAPLN